MKMSLSNSQPGVLTQIRSGYRWSDWGIESLGALQKSDLPKAEQSETLEHLTVLA